MIQFSVFAFVFCILSAAGGAHLGAAEPAPEVETLPATLLGIHGLTVNGRIQPHGLPATYHFEYGPTAAYGLNTPEKPLPPKLAAYYRESWDEGWNGWMSWDTRLQHFSDGGALRGYIRYSGCPRDDHNHDDGIGTVHLAQYMYPGRIELSVPSAYLAAGDPDFRDAKIKIAIRGIDWRPNGTELMWWSQSQSNTPQLHPCQLVLYRSQPHRPAEEWPMGAGRIPAYQRFAFLELLRQRRPRQALPVLVDRRNAAALEPGLVPHGRVR
jgi:hypothetical protein